MPGCMLDDGRSGVCCCKENGELLLLRLRLTLPVKAGVGAAVSTQTSPTQAMDGKRGGNGQWLAAGAGSACGAHWPKLLCAGGRCHVLLHCWPPTASPARAGRSVPAAAQPTAGGAKENAPAFRAKIPCPAKRCVCRLLRPGRRARVAWPGAQRLRSSISPRQPNTRHHTPHACAAAGRSVLLRACCCEWQHQPASAVRLFPAASAAAPGCHSRRRPSFSTLAPLHTPAAAAALARLGSCARWRQSPLPPPCALSCSRAIPSAGLFAVSARAAHRTRGLRGTTGSWLPSPPTARCHTSRLDPTHSPDPPTSLSCLPPRPMDPSGGTVSGGLQDLAGAGAAPPAAAAAAAAAPGACLCTWALVFAAGAHPSPSPVPRRLRSTSDTDHLPLLARPRVQPCPRSSSSSRCFS